MPVFTGISHVDLTVRDADRSAAWYERVLCMRLLGEFTEFATPWLSAYVVQVMNPATGQTFGLVQHASGEDVDFSEFRVGLDHLSLAVESRVELDQWVEHLDGCGVPHSAIHEMPYGSVVVFRDPDNIQLELFALAPDFRPPE
jgi:catechol 2,3-dioxygenase-like lactoylglutathione lyase family enzyme